MSNSDDLSSQIETAKGHGYSPDEIIGYLGKSHPDLADKITKAKTANYGSNEILGFLSKPAVGKPKLKAKTPEETKQFLQKRYPQAYQEQPGVTKQVLTGVGKGSARGVSSLLGPFDPAGWVEDFGGKTGLEPKGPGEEAGSHLSNLLFLLLPGPKKAAAEAVEEAIPVVGRVLKGAVQGAASTKGWQPGAAAGAGVGYMVSRTPQGAEIGAAIGGGLPSVRGAIQGAIRGYRNLPAEIERLDSISQRKLAFKLYEETHGKPPASAKESIDAIREMKEAAKTAKVEKANPPVKPPPVRYGSRVEPEAPKKTPAPPLRFSRVEPEAKTKVAPPPLRFSRVEAEAAEAAGSPAASVEQPTVSRPGAGVENKPPNNPADPVQTTEGKFWKNLSAQQKANEHRRAVKQLFAEGEQTGIKNTELRAAVRKYSGKGISEMTYEEVLDVNNRLKDPAARVEMMAPHNAEKIVSAIGQTPSTTAMNLRTKLGLSKEEFDAAAIEASKQGKVFLNSHFDPHKLPPGEQDFLIFDKRNGKYYVSISPR